MREALYPAEDGGPVLNQYRSRCEEFSALEGPSSCCFSFDRFIIVLWTNARTRTCTHYCLGMAKVWGARIFLGKIFFEEYFVRAIFVWIWN